MILLDTETCIEILKGNSRVMQRRAEHRNQEAAICFMTVAELFFGVERSANPQENRGILEAFLLTVPLIPSEIPILRRFGTLKAILKRSGALLPDADIFIAAVALEKADFLVTGNTRHFERFEGLRLENWIR